MSARARRLLLLAAILALALLLAGCGGGKKRATKVNGCDLVAKPPARTTQEPRPTVLLSPGTRYNVTLTTNCGSFTFRIDQAQSPRAAASFVALVRKGFFDKTLFHRIVPGFVIQGGDPTESGSGGPGYTVVDKPPAGAAYTFGVVAMAKTDLEPAGTSGSQFFVVTVANANLPPDYAIIGKVVSGQSVVKHIGRLGNANQQPIMTVEIEKATVSG